MLPHLPPRLADVAVLTAPVSGVGLVVAGLVRCVAWVDLPLSHTYSNEVSGQDIPGRIFQIGGTHPGIRTQTLQGLSLLLLPVERGVRDTDGDRTRFYHLDRVVPIHSASVP